MIEWGKQAPCWFVSIAKGCLSILIGFPGYRCLLLSSAFPNKDNVHAITNNRHCAIYLRNRYRERLQKDHLFRNKFYLACISLKKTFLTNKIRGMNG